MSYLHAVIFLNNNDDNNNDNNNNNNNNLITAINVLAVSLMKYSGGIIKWSQEELYKLDVATRKLMSMHGSFSVNSDINRLYVPRKFSGRGLVSVSFAIVE